jgi:hypothetical protein
VTREYEVPQSVQDNLRARARARSRQRPCVYDHCSNPAAVARGGGAAMCLECDRREYPNPPPTPDPARTLNGLRAAAGLRSDAFAIGRTVLDVRAEAKGQRVSTARRAQARGDAT